VEPQQSEQHDHSEPHPASLAQRLKHTLQSKVQRAKKKLEAIKQQQQQKRNLQQEEATTTAASTHPFNSPASPAIVSPGVSASRSPPQPTSLPQQLYSPILADREDGNGGHLTRELLQSVYNTRAEPRPWPMFTEDEEDKEDHSANVKEGGDEEESEIKQADQPPSWLSESLREQSSSQADEQKSMQQPQPQPQQQVQGEYAFPQSAASRLRSLLSAVMERVQYVLNTGEFGAPPPPQQQLPPSSSRNVSQANTQHLLESLHPTSTASLTSFSSGKSSQAQPNPQQQQEPAPQVQKQEPPASQRPLQPQALRRARSESKSENYDACVMHPASLPTPDELEDAEAQLMQATDDKTNDERPPLQVRRFSHTAGRT
jgi:hypothetical protein